MNKEDLKVITTYITKNVKILDVAKNYGLNPIKESDDRYKMMCPFHDEKTASLKIYNKSNTFKCFGCQKGTNVIDFIRSYENVSFMEVINRFKDCVNLNSKQNILNQMNDRFNKKDLIDLSGYANLIKYRLGIELRKKLRQDKNKKDNILKIHKEIDMFFNDISFYDKEKIDYFYEYITEKSMEL
jgi:DNA primase